jgi:MerR family redox-sensitive transcriptional activator SoxR
MSSLSIGQVAQICGLAPSAIRYYEKVGLLPKPVRVSRQRRYGSDIIGQLRLVQVARKAGFTIAETRTFIAGFPTTTPPSARWRTLGERKLAEIDSQIARLKRMQTLLRTGFDCQCVSIEDCARILGTMRPRHRGSRRTSNSR